MTKIRRREAAQLEHDLAARLRLRLWRITRLVTVTRFGDASRIVMLRTLN